MVAQTAACIRAGGKSGLHRAGCRVTPGEGNLRESATETRPPWSTGSGFARYPAEQGKGETAV